MSFLSGVFGKGKEATMLMILVGSFVLGVIVALVTAPLFAAEESYSAVRIGLEYVVSALTYLIPGVIAMLLFSKNQEWLAPPGRYTPDIEYKPFSPYMLTAAAIVGAIYAGSGLATGINVDIPALITAFTATFFGSVACFLGFFLGFFVRFAVGGAPWLATPVLVPVIAWIDGGVWSLNAFVYWTIMRKIGKDAQGVMKLVYFVISVAIMIGFHVFGWLIVWAFVVNPWDAFLGYIAFAFSTWYPTTIVFVIIGAVIGESAYYSRTALLEVE